MCNSVHFILAKSITYPQIHKQISGIFTQYTNKFFKFKIKLFFLKKDNNSIPVIVALLHGLRLTISNATPIAIRLCQLIEGTDNA